MRMEICEHSVDLTFDGGELIFTDDRIVARINRIDEKTPQIVGKALQIGPKYSPRAVKLAFSPDDMIDDRRVKPNPDEPVTVTTADDTMYVFSGLDLWFSVSERDNQTATVVRSRKEVANDLIKRFDVLEGSFTARVAKFELFMKHEFGGSA